MQKIELEDENVKFLTSMKNFEEEHNVEQMNVVELKMITESINTNHVQIKDNFKRSKL